jgi:hypothetical protein
MDEGPLNWRGSPAFPANRETTLLPTQKNNDNRHRLNHSEGAFMPLCRLFVRVCGEEHGGLFERTASQLQTNGESLPGKTARKGDGRETREIERTGVLHQPGDHLHPPLLHFNF